MRNSPLSLSTLDILGQISDAVLATDLDGRVLFWNAGAERLYGWSSGEAVGQSANDLLQSRFADPFETIVDSLLRAGRWEGELSRSRKGGERIDVLSRWSVLRDPQGAAVARMVIDTDLTETKFRFHELQQAQAHARTQADLLRCVLDATSDFAFLKDPEGRYLVINQSAAGALGKTPQEVVGKDDFALFPREFAARLRQDDLEVIASGEPKTYEEEFLGEGKPDYIHTSKSVCCDRTGQVIGVVGFARDVSEPRRLANELKQRERELREAHRIARLGSWSWVRDSDTVTWSDEVYRVFDRDPVLGEPKFLELMELHVPESRERLRAAVDAAVAEGTPYELDLEIVQPDGARRWIVARGEVEAWENGKVARLHGTLQEITERKRIEAQLALNENRYRSLVQATSQIVWTTNAAGEQVQTPKEWQLFTGQSDEEVQGFGWIDAIHPDDREGVMHAWRNSVASGALYNVEQRLRRYDGVYRNMAVRAVPVRNAVGRIAEWVGMVEDVTEQTQAREEVRGAREQLQHVLDSITDGLCVLDRDLRYTYFNENGARMLGYRPEDIVGRQFGDMFAENRSGSFEKAFRRSIETGEPGHIETYYADPLNRWIECQFYPSRSGLTVYFRDISERRKAEQVLRDTESRFRTLFESNLMGICIPDRFGAFKESNDELLRMLGYTREDLEQGRFRWDVMTPPEYLPSDSVHIAEAAERGSCTPYEKEYIRKDGTRMSVLVGYTLLEGSQDDYIGFVMDLTPLRRMEEALRRSEKLAMAGRFAASVAHEINNPLAAVTNAFYLALQDETIRPETQVYLRMAEQELSRVAQITTQTLRFHKQAKCAALADLAEIMESVFALYSSRLVAKHIAVDRDYDAGAAVDCFSDEMRHVFANLMSNALDAMPDGGRVRVRVKKAHTWDDRQVPGVRVTLADTGNGIPREMSKRVFEPFFSTKESTGIGLGLWVAQGIVGKHDGRIALRSRTGTQSGTVISLFFPKHTALPPVPTSGEL